MLAGNIGERHVLRPEALTAAGDYIISAWREQGYAPEREPFAVDGHACANLIASRPGRALADEILLIGAHYDTVRQPRGGRQRQLCGRLADQCLSCVPAGERPAQDKLSGGLGAWKCLG